MLLSTLQRWDRRKNPLQNPNQIMGCALEWIAQERDNIFWNIGEHFHSFSFASDSWSPPWMIPPDNPLLDFSAGQSVTYMEWTESFSGCFSTSLRVTNALPSSRVVLCRTRRRSPSDVRWPGAEETRGKDPRWVPIPSYIELIEYQPRSSVNNFPVLTSFVLRR